MSTHISLIFRVKFGTCKSGIILCTTLLIFILLTCSISVMTYVIYDIWAATCDFQQFGVLKRVDSDEPVQPPFKLRNSKCHLVSSLHVTLIKYSSD